MTTESDDWAISLTGVSKLYRTYASPQHRLVEILTGGRKRYARETRALDDVSFSLEKGGRLGVIGTNGSGKSTLLKVLAGVLTPTSGTVNINGRISALLELGAGFHPDLSGVGNIRQFCVLHGMHKDAIEEAVPQIIKFSELNDAIGYPVRTYSSGMSVRLGFACAVYAKPEILIVDEALSVGDAYFQNKCLHKIKSLLDNGVTFVYVTHAADAIRALCDRGLWMDTGRVRLSGSSSVVGAAYQSEMFRRMSAPAHNDATAGSLSSRSDKVEAEEILSVEHARHRIFEERVAPLRTGSGGAKVLDIQLVDTDGVVTDSVEFNTKVRVRVFYKIFHKLPSFTALNVGVTDSSGRQVHHLSSASKGMYISSNTLNAVGAVEFEFVSYLCPGEYGLIAGIGTFQKSPKNRGQSLIDEIIDYCAGGSRFSVRFPEEHAKENLDLWGIVYVPYSVSELKLVEQ